MTGFNFLLLVVLLSVSLSFDAYANTSTKFIPSDIKSTTMFFELPSYDEYTHLAVIAALKNGVVVEEKSILDEKSYNKIRNAKIQMIKSHYQYDYQIVTSQELARLNPTKGFIFQEKLITTLVSRKDTKFENYTNFKLENAANDEVFVLADPVPNTSSECVVKTGEYRYKDLILLIQE